MKKILITGANSYIGSSFENYMLQWTDEYLIDTMDMIDGVWRNVSFEGYDTVFHVAGLAHIKETKENFQAYYDINCDLAVEAAKKSKTDHVGQFIYLSSMSVYEKDTGIITKETIPSPKTNYGKSKLQAEQQLAALEADTFHIAILRPPMVYGKGCKGNYSRLAKLSLQTPIFPDVNNRRSMIYIDNLSEFVRQLIDTECAGLFFPQNPEYVRTSEMVQLIAHYHGSKIRLTKLFNPFIKLFRISEVNKVFGSLVYDKTMSHPFRPLPVPEVSESIRLTEL